MTTNGKLKTHDPTAVETPSRRTLLGVLVGGINLAVFATVLAPVTGFIGGPTRNHRRGKWVAVLPEGDLAVGQVKEVTFSLWVKDGYKQVKHNYSIYLRRDSEKVEALDPACTHLGCRVRYQDSKHRFICPCHGGVFNDKGEVVSGPPPKPLEKYAVKLESGKIWVMKEV